MTKDFPVSEQNEPTAMSLVGEPPAQNASGFTSRNDVSTDDLLLDEYSRSVVSAVARVAPAVVNIEIEQRVKNRTDVAGSGSGFVITPDGFIVTNSHVVNHSTRIVVNAPDGRDRPAQLTGDDPDTHLALIPADA